MNNKKTKTLIWVVTVFWIAAFTQVLVNNRFMNENKITTAFAATNAKMVESGLEVTAICGQKTESEKRQIISDLAKEIGCFNHEIITKEKRNNQEIFQLKSKEESSTTSIKLVGSNDNTKNYIYIKLSMDDKMNKILDYKKILEQTLDDLKISEYQTMLKFSGEYSGDLSERQKQEETNNLMGKLGAKVVSKSIDNGLYSIYGYTGLIKEYIKVADYRVNINVVFSYDEKENITNLYLATPILNGDY